MSHRGTHTSADTDSDVDALWTRQERLRNAVLDGQPSPVVDQALYLALAQMRPPPPPEDLAASILVIATRSAEARRRVARFRRTAIRLFALLYLPAVTAVSLLFAADIPEIWYRTDPAQRVLLQWMAVIGFLAATSALGSRAFHRDSV
ncbi:MAG: hypothetical protein E6Q88_09800 [Lysobacteraceae bacterium]|nr:MAG: hypothetical protein E6Q88_09800 [Xanthomonadaceae bacterium]